MNSPWNAERIERLTQLWRDGFSASQIAERLGGATRNAVIGKVHRLGLPSRQTRRRARIVRTAVRTPKARNRQPKARPWRPLPRPVVLALPQPAPAAGLALLDLGPCSCRWPYGDPKGDGFGYCGHLAAPGSAYCPHHHRRAHQ